MKVRRRSKPTRNTVPRAVAAALRRQAVPLFAAGLTAGAIARRLGVTRTSTLRWRDALRAGKSLEPTKSTGRPRKVNRELVRDMITAYDIRSAKQLRLAITVETGVIYNLDHAQRLFRTCLSP